MINYLLFLSTILVSCIGYSAQTQSLQNGDKIVKSLRTHAHAIGPITEGTRSGYDSFMSELSSGDTAYLLINSGGGLVDEGVLMMDISRGYRKAGIRTVCIVETAESMAFHILDVVCDEIHIDKNSVLMWHRPFIILPPGTPITLVDAESIVADLKSMDLLTQEMLKGTYTKNPAQFLKSYYESDVWNGAAYCVAFAPPAKWKCD